MRTALLSLFAAFALTGCPSPAPSDSGADSGTSAQDDGPSGYIGGPCATLDDCPYPDAACLTDGQGFPRGTCSQACELYCPDEPGFPTTFCVTTDELPPGAAELGAGACLSRCDFGYFPETGCRDGYGCSLVPRANEPGTLKYACVPGATSEVSLCQRRLAARGVTFEPSFMPDAHPDGHPELTCHIEDPVYLVAPIHGVDVRYADSSDSARILASCDAAHAIVDTIDDLGAHDAVVVRHLGTYNCRVIAGTSSLSRHGYGDAFDIAGVQLASGAVYTLTNDWEHDTTSPTTPGGKYLYESGLRWHNAGYWSLILTPNYNSAHDDHFHVDLTPGQDAIYGRRPPHYYGPAPYDD